MSKKSGSSKETRYVRALYNYDAKDENQLNITPGDVIEVYFRDESGWWDGKNWFTKEVCHSSVGEDIETLKQHAH